MRMAGDRFVPERCEPHSDLGPSCTYQPTSLDEATQMVLDAGMSEIHAYDGHPATQRDLARDIAQVTLQAGGHFMDTLRCYGREPQQETTSFSPELLVKAAMAGERNRRLWLGLPNTRLVASVMTTDGEEPRVSVIEARPGYAA